MHMDLSELAGDSVANTPLSSSVNASVKEENAVMAVEQGAVDAGKASAEKEDQASATEEKPIVKEEEPAGTGATLIISPFQICHQWIEEIQKHVQEKCLKVFVYTGVNKLGFVQPRTLSSQDIVVTTYETLRKELDYVDLPHSNITGDPLWVP
nr:hypothetical protein BaRGS_022916 [Batillaria attramentaria]KAG5703333.1 hypothetical protein BaRGS_025575 [Batillaria attramentaria]